MSFPFEPPYRNKEAFPWAYHRPSAPKPYWASGPQAQEDKGSLGTVLGVTAGVIGAGFIPIGDGRRLWDKYLAGIRHIEELSPARIFRTFQYSETLSPFGTHRTFNIPEEFFTHTYYDKAGFKHTVPIESMRKLTARMTGTGTAELAERGVFDSGLSFRRTGTFFGQVGGPGGVLTKAALPLRVGTSKGGTFLDWYARVSGIDLPMTEGVTDRNISGMAFVSAPKIDRLWGIDLSERAALNLQKARVIGRYMRAYWAGQIGRLNKLLQNIVDLPGVGKVLTKISDKLNFSMMVKPGTASQMLMRYAGKGLAVAAAFKLFEGLGYLRSDTQSRIGSTAVGAGVGAGVIGLMSRSPKGALVGAAIGAIVGGAPLFDKGITEGIATAVTRMHTGYARYVSEPLGLTEAAREQEELMPGITKVKTMGGLAGAGLLLGLVGKGIGRYVTQAKIGDYDLFDVQAKEWREALTREAEEAEGFLGRARAKLWPKVFKGKPFARAAMTGGKLGMVAGAAIGLGFMATAAIATGSLPGILGTEKTSKELEDIYSGREEIPIRKGRYWEMGRSNWEGNRIQYYRKHWYPLMLSKARTKGLWGSEEAKYAADPFFHPWKALTDEEFQYRWEREHYYDRPYPMTGSYGQEVPFIGPIVGAIGRLIKPPRLMHTDEWLRGGDVQPTLGQIPEDAAVKHVVTAAENEPAPELGGIPRGTPVSPHRFDQELGRMIYNVNELRGLTGFMHGAIKEHITGSQDYFDDLDQLETARRAYGAERWYWGKELGGLLGNTEAFRRFLPHRRRQIGLYNPIRNTMPEWLPGPDYYKDFRHGDPYTEVAQGELRLPGPGYAALNPDVAGLRPEEYPLFHRYKILADVAMYSNEFKQTRREVHAALRRGYFSEEQARQIGKINQQISEKKKRKSFSEYQYSQDALEKMQVRVKEQISPGMFTTEQHGIIKLSGIQMSRDNIAQDNKEKLASGDYRRKRAIISDYLREHIQPGEELNVYVHKDRLHRFEHRGGVSYQPAAIEAGGVDLGRSLVEQGLAEFEKDSLFAAQSKYSAKQRLVGAAWENIAHYELPLEYLQPMSPMSKFLHQRSAIEEYERTRVYGTEAAFWQHPVKNFIKPAYWMAREQLGTSEIPENIQHRWEIEGYFDRLKYLKYQMLERAANASGLEQDAKEFKKQQRRTLFGVNPYGPLANIFSALPSLERDYFQEFADADSVEERARIMELIPPDERPIYQAQWSNRLANALRAERDMGLSGENVAKTLTALHYKKITEGRPSSPKLFNLYNKDKQEGESYADWSRRKELQEYFKEYPLPGPDWVAWHPHVDLEDVKLKMIESLGEDMHDYNLWDSRRRTLVRKPYIEKAVPAVLQEPEEDPQERVRKIEAVLRHTLNMQNVRVIASPNPGGGNVMDFDLHDKRLAAIRKFKSDPDYFGTM